MAAYSAVSCFRQTLKQLLDSDQFPLLFQKPQIQSLYETVGSLQFSLDKIPFVPKKWGNDLNELQTRIRDAVYAAQDRIDYSISKGHSSERSDESSLKKIAHDIELVAKEAETMAEKIRNDSRTHKLLLESTIEKDNLESRQPAKSRLDSKDMIVGQQEDYRSVTEEVLSEDEQRLVIPITGLPGLGKTTLARSIYEDRKIHREFNIRAWVTVSQEYTFQEIFSKILNSMESKNYQAGHYASQGDEQTLLHRVHQELYNVKYLIVIDDLWDTRVWDRLILALPDKENGSRVLVTTRIQTVATAIKTSGYIHEMQPLGLEDGWKLLCYKVFGDTVEVNPPHEKDITEACPPHLRETGRSIAEKCEGLPLSITVVAGLLYKGREELQYWKRVEQDTADASADGKDSYLEILSLSYSYLPAKLKGCFLYMGAFPEDSEIRASKLIKLWVAEGFFTSPLDPNILGTTLELDAHKSLEELISRNLISSRKNSSSGGIKVCGMHDSLRELAEQEARKERFFHSRRKYNQKPEEDMQRQRRVSVHINLLMSHEQVYQSTKSIKYARSLLYVGPHHHHPLPFCLTFDLLRVLDALTVYFIQFPHQFLELVHLTYLSLTYNHDLPPKICQLQKLQVLMVRRQPKLIFVGVSFLPDEIWNMPELRHLWFTETDFPALPPAPPLSIPLLLNLQTLANVNAVFFTNDILDHMPNLTKLAMWIEAPDKLNFNVAKLSKLENFKFVVLNPIPGKGIQVEAEHFFPKTLKRLNLSGCGLPWEYMEFVAKNSKDLQVLKLKELAFHGNEWCPDYQFKELKYLMIEYLNFQIWGATTWNYPRLKCLILRHCYELEEIPQDIGNIGTLELIELVDCGPEAVASAQDIIAERVSFGKPPFQGRIFSSCE